MLSNGAGGRNNSGSRIPRLCPDRAENRANKFSTIHSFMDCCTSVPMPDTADAKGTRTQAFVIVWDTDTMVDNYDTRLKVP